MIEKILVIVIAGIILSGISGLTYFAYKHTIAYLKIQKYILSGIVIIFVLISCWNMATLIGGYKVMHFVESSKQNLAQEALQSIQFPFLLSFIISTFLFLYLGIIGILFPKITLGRRKDDLTE